MTAQQILRQAIREYNIDTFDEEQKHLHVTLGEFKSPLGTIIGISIPRTTGTLTLNELYIEESEEEQAYERLLITFIKSSLYNVSK